MVRICFVCLGNICRSPTAEAIMENLIEQAGLQESIEVDSAGTGDWHVGDPPDARATAAAKRRGLSVHGRARRFAPEDFDTFDYVVAMDKANRNALKKLAHDKTEKEKIELLRNYDADSPRDASVPDPYYGGQNGFEEVLDICEAGCRGLLTQVRQEHNL